MKKMLVLLIILMMFSVCFLGGCLENNNSSDYGEEKYNSLQNKYDSLYDEHSDLLKNYNNLVNQYNELLTNYNKLDIPLVSIKNRTIHWRFYLLDGTQLGWTLDMETYLTYASMSDPVGVKHLLLSSTGETYTIKDLNNYVTANFFNDVIPTLTTGKTDVEFVQEVVNIKNQIITYSTGLENQYRWPAETLTEGTGNCGDTSILIASLLKAGENQENYGLEVYFWYCDAGHMTDPQDITHAIVEVKYTDGSSLLIETTSDTFYTHEQIKGWQFEV